MLVAALNIISGLIMLVKDKGHDIAILRTMGATRGAIMRIFFIAGAGDRHYRHARRASARPPRLRQHRAACAQFIGWLTSTEALLAGALLPDAAAGRNGPGETMVVVWRSACRILATLYPVLAGGPARSGRGAALRVGSSEWKLSVAGAST